MNTFIRTLTIKYKEKFRNDYIPGFRGAVIKKIGRDGKADTLYHNHLDDNTFRYSYPLIQYKRLNGQAAIVCIEEGVDIIGKFLSVEDKQIKILDNEINLTIDRVTPSRLLVKTWQKNFKYKLLRWTPLSSKNFIVFKDLEDEVEKRRMLEKILVGNILSMLKGIGIHMEDELIVKIHKLSTPYSTINKGIKMLTFDAEFTCNLTIPDYIGLGKNASIGFGVVYQIREKKDYTASSEQNSDLQQTI